MMGDIIEIKHRQFSEVKYDPIIFTVIDYLLNAYSMAFENSSTIRSMDLSFE